MSALNPARAAPPPADVALSAAHLRAAFRQADVTALGPSHAAADEATIAAILDQAQTSRRRC
jgi:hypothetical protein